MEVAVRDTGVGIGPKEIPHLFKKFGKLYRTAEINSQGIGLGLLIVKQIVESNKGKVWVESEGPGHGSTFSFNMSLEKAAYDQVKDAKA